MCRPVLFVLLVCGIIHTSTGNECIVTGVDAARRFSGAWHPFVDFNMARNAVKSLFDQFIEGTKGEVTRHTCVRRCYKKWNHLGGPYGGAYQQLFLPATTKPIVDGFEQLLLDLPEQESNTDSHIAQNKAQTTQQSPAEPSEKAPQSKE